MISYVRTTEDGEDIRNLTLMFLYAALMTLTKISRHCWLVIKRNQNQRLN